MKPNHLLLVMLILPIFLGGCTITSISTGSDSITGDRPMMGSGGMGGPNGSGPMMGGPGGGTKKSGIGSGMITSADDSATNPSPIHVTGCDSASGYDKILCLIAAFKGQLDSTQLASLQRIYSTDEAKKWSNLPQKMANPQRVGLSISSMTSIQIQYLKALIKVAAGSEANEGRDELQQTLNADQYLEANGGGNDYGISNYYIAFLGTPSTTGTWELQFGGHHFAFANTYKDGKLVGATPSFRGSEPFDSFVRNNTTNHPLMQEKDAFSAILSSLSDAELSGSNLGTTFGDIIVGPNKDWTFPTTPSGIKISTLNNSQKQLIIAAIKTYVGDVANSDEFMTKYIKELDNTYLSHVGTTGMIDRNDYIRIDGPSIWLEYSSQGGIIFSETHPHSVWRDKVSDYGGNK